VRRHHDRHHRRSIHLRNYDYSQVGYYYVTIRVEDGRCLFGEVVNGEMHLNNLGRIVQQCWFEICSHFPDVRLDLFVVMPNHLHGILQLRDHRRGTACRAPTQMSKAKQKEQFGKPVHGSLPTIMRSFKSAVTRRIRKLHNMRRIFKWQRGYYEHVVRSETELNIKRQYILNNPLKWQLDRNNPANWWIL
jgi:putative transposase